MGPTHQAAAAAPCRARAPQPGPCSIRCTEIPHFFLYEIFFFLNIFKSLQEQLVSCRPIHHCAAETYRNRLLGEMNWAARPAEGRPQARLAPSPRLQSGLETHYERAAPSALLPGLPLAYLGRGTPSLHATRSWGPRYLHSIRPAKASSKGTSPPKDRNWGDQIKSSCLTYLRNQARSPEWEGTPPTSHWLALAYVSTLGPPPPSPRPFPFIDRPPASTKIKINKLNYP